MNRYQTMYPFDQQFFGVMPVYAFVMGPVYQVGANWNLMCAFMPQPYWRAGPGYRNRLHYRQRSALMPKECNKPKQERQQEQKLKKTEELKQKQEKRQEEHQQEFKKPEEEEKVKNEPKQEVEVDETNAWQIPRLYGKQPQKKLLQMLILEEEVIDALQDRHLEEELRAKHALQKIHLEEELKAKRELKMRHLEEQLRVMHSLQKQQLEEELREKKLLQERQLEDELKAKESLQRRHLEEELRVKELLLNRTRVSRKQQHECKKQTSIPRQQHDLQEKPTKNQLRQELDKLRQLPGHADVKKKQLKKLLTQQICQLKQEIQLEKTGTAKNCDEQKHDNVINSVILDESLYPLTRACDMPEAECAKHSNPLWHDDHPVESDTLEGCVEIHEELPNLSGLTAYEGCSTDSTSTSRIEKTDTRKSPIIDSLSNPVITDANKDGSHTLSDECGRNSLIDKSNCKSPDMKSKSSSFSVKSNDQYYIQFGELGQILPTGPVIEFESYCSSFSVISETNDENVAGVMINGRDKNYTMFDEFGRISSIEHCGPSHSKFLPSESENSCSSFSVISETSFDACDDFGRILKIGKIKSKSPDTESKLRSSSVKTIDKDRSYTRCDDFGGISPIEKCKSPTTDSKSSSFSVMTIDKAYVDESGTISAIENSNSTSRKSLEMEYKSCQRSFSVIPDTIDNNADGLPKSDKHQNHMQFDESFRKDCIRCGRPFYVNDLGEYLKSETCTYHWGTLHYMYKGKQGYTAQYTCCKGHKDSEGCIRSALHIWSGVVNSP
ncbi:FK506-binding protein 5-like [Zeugodacus cucurbitae]|uniref:FK506-binding protein 5-like n=1 Tax=Zeugodacus cucurbitae TaxID=28588 RepID=UPI0023D93FCC|nr:FK506-binding protein 5-like [Zeugodacus cucurbitae]